MKDEEGFKNARANYQFSGNFLLLPKRARYSYVYEILMVVGIELSYFWRTKINTINLCTVICLKSTLKRGIKKNKKEIN